MQDASVPNKSNHSNNKTASQWIFTVFHAKLLCPPKSSNMFLEFCPPPPKKKNWPMWPTFWGIFSRDRVFTEQQRFQATVAEDRPILLGCGDLSIKLGQWEIRGSSFSSILGDPQIAIVTYQPVQVYRHFGKKHHDSNTSSSELVTIVSFSIAMLDYRRALWGCM